MSHFHGEKDDSTNPTQRTLDRFFHSSENHSNTNGTNGASSVDASGGNNYCNDVTMKDECSRHDAGKDISIDQQSFFSHNEKLSVPEGTVSSNMKVLSQSLTEILFIIYF
jgi:Ca2+-transporting ATPase/DNA polymerase kappa